jgi:hypothetical protein
VEVISAFKMLILIMEITAPSLLAGFALVMLNNLKNLLKHPNINIQY